MSWSRRFDDPIQPPKGKKLLTLKDAAAYITALPKSKQQSPGGRRRLKRAFCGSELLAAYRYRCPGVGAGSVVATLRSLGGGVAHIATRSKLGLAEALFEACQNVVHR
jgi:hypothetical protein